MTPAEVDPSRLAAIDIGLNNLAAVTFDQPGIMPFLVNGRPLKTINQWYNKRRARLQAKLPAGGFDSQQLDILTDKRARQINHYLHVASRRIVDQLVKQRIGMLVVGKNDGWKQAIELGKRTNQNFVFVPHARFIEMLRYKAELVGIHVVVSEESYTFQMQLPRPGADTHEASRRVYSWQAHQARTVPGCRRASPQRGHQWRVQHHEKSSPGRLRQRDRGCSSSPRQDCPGEWAAWQQCPCRLELYIVDPLSRASSRGMLGLDMAKQ